MNAITHNFTKTGWSNGWTYHSACQQLSSSSRDWNCSVAIEGGDYFHADDLRNVADAMETIKNYGLQGKVPSFIQLMTDIVKAYDALPEDKQFKLGIRPELLDRVRERGKMEGSQFQLRHEKRKGRPVMRVKFREHDVLTVHWLGTPTGEECKELGFHLVEALKLLTVFDPKEERIREANLINRQLAYLKRDVATLNDKLRHGMTLFGQDPLSQLRCKVANFHNTDFNRVAPHAHRLTGAGRPPDGPEGYRSPERTRAALARQSLDHKTL